MIRRAVINHLILSVLLWSCESTQNKVKTSPEAQTTQINTANAAKVGNNWAVPKKSFEYNSVGESKGDTITFATCSDFVYSPFGELKDKSQLKNSLLKNFNVTDRTDTMDTGAIEFQILTLKDSRLILFFKNDPEASRSSYIQKGEIKNSEVNLADDIKIGMSKKDFIRTFFESFPDEALASYNHFVFESCVTDIWHIYTFSSGKLTSIKFTTDSYWEVDYKK